MEAIKQQRLEAAGWKVGTLAEFLGLSEEEAALVKRAMKIADMERRHAAAYIAQPQNEEELSEWLEIQDGEHNESSTLC